MYHPVVLLGEHRDLHFFAQADLPIARSGDTLERVYPDITRAADNNLDVIISVGYRVKSQQGTRFRQWATRTLREHLTRGWTLNRRRFEANARELEAAMALVRKTAQSPELTTDSGRGLVDIVARYAQTFLLLQRYDEGLLTDPPAQAGGRLPSVK